MRILVVDDEVKLVRARGRWVPILMLAARDAVGDRIRGLRAHGGRIWAEAGTEGGARFSFAIPLDR